MTLLLKLLAPWISTGIFWCIFENGWLAILVYHAQVLFWSRKSWSRFRWPKKKWALLIAGPTALAGPLLYWLLPMMSHTDIGIWLDRYNLTGWSLAIMVPYFGIIHPIMEQLHWAELREKTPLSHLFFAGYHMLVLYSIVTLPWLVFGFIMLATTSGIWQYLTHRTGSLSVAALSHVLADLGFILTADLLLNKPF